MLNSFGFTGNTTAAGPGSCALTASAVDCSLPGREGGVALSKLRGRPATTHTATGLCQGIRKARLQAQCVKLPPLQQVDNLGLTEQIMAVSLDPCESVVACRAARGVTNSTGQTLPEIGADMNLVGLKQQLWTLLLNPLPMEQPWKRPD